MSNSAQRHLGPGNDYGASGVMTYDFMDRMKVVQRRAVLARKALE